MNDAAEPDDEALIDQYLEERDRQAAERREAQRATQYNLAEALLSGAMAVAPVVASGIVGNLSYDLLKNAVNKSRSGPKPPKASDLLKELALHAVREQCHRYGLEVPELKDMRIRWANTKAGATAHVTCRRLELTARVVIPYYDRESRGVEVRLVGVSQREVTDRRSADHQL